ncbi:MAG: DUF4838 domain-containing protein, partial [Flavisolibacter sp.]
MKIKLLMLLQLLVVLATAQTNLPLVTNGKTVYHIVVSDSATADEQEAASILQQYIRKISGAEMAIERSNGKPQSQEIVIGQTNRTSTGEWNRLSSGLNNDGFYLKTIGKRFFIAGGKGKGPIYGVTGFLEDYLGCRKYSPDVEVVPSKRTISIGQINDRQVPKADIRIVHGDFVNDEGYKNWRKLVNIADVWNDGDWRGYFVHTFNRLVPPAEYFGTHPEYYSLVNGKRISYGQLCLSNPDVLQITIAQLKKDMGLHPTLRYWSVSQNDTYDYCQCDQCKKINEEEGSPMGSLLQFVNKVAAVFPDKVITTLAYQYSRTPPLKTKPAPNVMITLCTIELNRSLPIETDPSSVSFKNDIVGWSKICNNIMLWDYEIQFTNYLCPFPLFHTLQPNIQFFTKYGVKAHFQQCNTGHGEEFSELKSYLLSKLLWNPTANTDSIINDFMRGYYGKAAPYVRAYFDRLHQQARISKQGLDIYGTPVWNAKTFLSSENIKEYNDLFDKAENAVKDNPAVLERVKIARLPVQFADMEIAKTDMFGERGWYRIENGKYLLRPERKQLLDDFYNCCKRNNIVHLNETGLTTDVYYANTLRFIDVQTEGNLAFQKPVTCKPLPDEKYSGTGPDMLTNGVKGTDDYKINWLGWQGTDVEVMIDLQKKVPVKEITLSSLQFPKSWILHPLRVACFISDDGINFENKGVVASNPDLTKEEQMKDFSFAVAGVSPRYIKLVVEATKTLPAWHNYAGNKSWVF